MASIKFIRNERKTKKDGLAPLSCRITHKRKHAYFNLGYSIHDNEWDKKKSLVKKSHPNYKKINLRISTLYSRIQKIILDLDLQNVFYSAQDIKQTLNGGANINFISFARKFVNNKYNRKEIEISTHNKYNTVINKLDEYTSGSLKISDVSQDFLNKYAKHLEREYKNGINTIGINLKCIRVITQELIRQGKIDVNNNPFKSFKIRFEETQRKFLYQEEIQKIRDLKLDPGTRIYDVRNIFLFCIETGLRIGEVLFLKKTDFNGSSIHYYSQKSKSYEMLPLTERAKAIINKTIRDSPSEYQFAFRFIDHKRLTSDEEILNEKKRKTSLINKYLKDIGNRATLTIKLSSHVARHSMAVNALSKGLSYAEIKSLLNHSDVKTTQIYAKTNNRMKLAAVNKLN